MHKDDELILVVPSDIIFSKGKWQGLKTDNLDEYVDLIKKNYQFKRRGDMEHDASYQQIIPYIIYSYKDNYFAYKYLPSAGESRLVDTYQLGVGGHINHIDGDDENGNVLEKGMMREWDEEVHYAGNILKKELVGIINDESAPVEEVHLGLLYHFTGDSPDISIKETEKMAGELMHLEEIKKCVATNPESAWLQIAYHDYLAKLSQ